MRLVVVTQAVDRRDPVLGATVPKLRALAERVDELVVLALREGEHGLPANVRVKSIAAPSQALRGARFAAALAPELRRRPVAVLAHMAPIYAVLAAPPPDRVQDVATSPSRPRHGGPPGSSWSIIQ